MWLTPFFPPFQRCYGQAHHRWELRSGDSGDWRDYRWRYYPGDRPCPYCFSCQPCPCSGCAEYEEHRLVRARFAQCLGVWKEAFGRGIATNVNCVWLFLFLFSLEALFSFDFLIWLDRRIILCDAHCFMMAMLIYLSIFVFFFFFFSLYRVAVHFLQQFIPTGTAPRMVCLIW